MKKHIIITIILLVAVVAVTVVYFKNLNTTTASSTGKVMESIPNTAGLVFEFGNDAGFYDIFKDNDLLTNIAGKQKMQELDLLRRKLLNAPLLKNYFNDQHIYVSIHGQPADSISFLITVAGSAIFSKTHIAELAKQAKTGLKITDTKLGGKNGYSIYLDSLKKTFYVADKGNNIFSGSFSKPLAEQSAGYKPAKGSINYLQIPDQQNNNSLANLYVNYEQLTPLFDMFFKSTNNSVLKTLRMMPGLAALPINYRKDALIFNGYTNIQTDKRLSYATLFRKQQPTVSKLKDLLPSTTALSTCFTLSDVKKFAQDLDQFHKNAGLEAEKNTLFKKVKDESGVSLPGKFNGQLTGEFAVVTTRFDEKFAIIPIKDPQSTRQLMVSISNMATDDVGQFRYNKLPFFLLGDAFSVFNHPYFMILDGYLILSNSQNELNSFKDSYDNDKFLNRTDGFQKFDNLLAERCNVSYLIHFRNVYPLLKRDMKPSYSTLFNPDGQIGDRLQALSWQLSGADGSYYTNFCLTFND
ncbi:hypothetical protein [Mucilaginibacter myungsuensis]|uniref:DUF3352 domain-containing protein n=1 Tax=Mucilaginibacter myungsuensis TaxID=649104 RepID=A0A929PWI3_9SPHI|nr:hypothetical protein [Mucilaginibacter myungsuensis]MBE9662164.1 hypothetical protein [Mucilaginibacter myungsuensis]MDN3599402.1 hypothetical protein [Mucilaginibacter myungsuensis]